MYIKYEIWIKDLTQAVGKSMFYVKLTQTNEVMLQSTSRHGPRGNANFVLTRL